MDLENVYCFCFAHYQERTLFETAVSVCQPVFLLYFC